MSSVLYNVICDLVEGQIGLKKWLMTETLRTLLLGIDIDID
jgi:hypothetical protein